MREDFVYLSGGGKRKIFDIRLAGVSYCDGSYHIVRENSSVFCIEYVLDGEGVVKTCGKTHVAEKGDTYLLLKGERHDYFSDAENPWEKIWMNFDGELAQRLIDLYGLRNATVVKCDTYGYFKNIHGILLAENVTEEEKMEKCSVEFHKMLIKLKNFYPVNESLICSDAELLREYLDKNIRESVTIKDLSALIYKSPSQTIRIFKNNFGVTPYEYHLKNKLRKAVELLQNTNLSVRETAFYLGFSDEHYFSNVFKKKMGCNATQYRKK